MVRRCNKVHVRIYVDAIFNHMSGISSLAYGTGGSSANKYHYPAVPYRSEHFHPTCQISDYHDTTNVRNCELVKLQDLDQSKEYVRGQIVDYLNGLIDVGVAGFRLVNIRLVYPPVECCFYCDLT